jgi:hypothetical protein
MNSLSPGVNLCSLLQKQIRVTESVVELEAEKNSEGRRT